jgi:hypothetical protein
MGQSCTYFSGPTVKPGQVWAKIFRVGLSFA